MKLLALETSGTFGSVALWETDSTAPARHWWLSSDQRSARTLAPAIDQAFAEFGWQPAEIGLVAVTTGPGSFTGLRVGVVTAKAFAYAVGCPAVGVDTLEVIARQAGLKEGRVWAVMDAQRGELYAAQWSRETAAGSPALRCLQPTRVIPGRDWLAWLQPGDRVSGPGLERWLGELPAHAVAIARELWTPSAAFVAEAAWEAFQSQPDKAVFDPMKLVPQYFRRTAAEEQWDKRQAKKPNQPGTASRQSSTDIAATAAERDKMKDVRS